MVTKVAKGGVGLFGESHVVAGLSYLVRQGAHQSFTWLEGDVKRRIR